MATIMTFTSLMDDLQSYLERSILNDPNIIVELPRIINRTEREMARQLKILGLKTPFVSTLTAGVSTYAKPDRWRDTVSMNYGAGEDTNEHTFIFPRSYEYCRTYWPNASLRDAPLFYSDYDYEHWLIVPTPIATVPWEVLCYMLPALLDVSNQQNWVSQYLPDVLLNGCLANCETYLKDDARLPMWKSEYEKGLAIANGEDLQRIIDATVSRQEA